MEEKQQVRLFYTCL